MSAVFIRWFAISLSRVGGIIRWFKTSLSRVSRIINIESLKHMYKYLNKQLKQMIKTIQSFLLILIS